MSTFDASMDNLDNVNNDDLEIEDYSDDDL